ncbi:hypothetical protein A3709_18860 [Halioglobus sp. HI00S01]|nr:hypothetical protein A3709_18860 [Halioglobus sp. HI00S01]
MTKIRTLDANRIISYVERNSITTHQQMLRGHRHIIAAIDKLDDAGKALIRAKLPMLTRSSPPANSSLAANQGTSRRRRKYTVEFVQRQIRELGVRTMAELKAASPSAYSAIYRMEEGERDACKSMLSPTRTRRRKWPAERIREYIRQNNISSVRELSQQHRAVYDASRTLSAEERNYALHGLAKMMRWTPALILDYVRANGITSYADFIQNHSGPYQASLRMSEGDRAMCTGHLLRKKRA